MKLANKMLLPILVLSLSTPKAQAAEKSRPRELDALFDYGRAAVGARLSREAGAAQAKQVPLPAECKKAISTFQKNPERKEEAYQSIINASRGDMVDHEVAKALRGVLAADGKCSEAQLTACVTGEKPSGGRCVIS